MRLLPLSGLALAAGLFGCQAHTAEAPPPTTAAAPAADAAPPPAATPPAAEPAAAPTATPTAAAPAADDNEEAYASLREHHRHHHHGGITAFVALALDSLGIDDAQHAQIAQIRTDLSASLEPAREAERQLTRGLAEGIASGNVDNARVESAIGKLSHAASETHTASVDALNRLHAVLTPTERQALVDKVQAHYEVWRRVNHEDEVGGREAGGRLAGLAEEVNLTPAQLEKISASLHEGKATQSKFEQKETEAHIQAFEAAFASDAFDARKLANGGVANGHMAAHGARRMVHFYATVTPILTAEQRTQLAENLREHLNHQQATAMGK